MPHDDMLHAVLWDAHAVLAYVFFLTILLHVSAALLHAWIRRDEVFASMAPWRSRRALATQALISVRTMQ